MDIKMISFCSQYRRKQKSNLVYAKFIMLCGKQTSNSLDNRKHTNNILSKRKDVFTIYSEEVFSILNPNHKIDLLKFEELLVEISDGVILFLESMGTAAELGAFAYLDVLAQKTLVFCDSKFEKDQSFINGGPLKRIIEFSDVEQNLGGVVYTKFLENQNIDFGSSDIYPKIISFANKKTISISVENLSIDTELREISIKPQLLVHYLIDVIFVFEIVKRSEIYEILSLLLTKSNYKFKIKFESLNKFNSAALKEYFIDLLIKWKIVMETPISTDNDSILEINFESIDSRSVISKSLGKALFTNSLFESKEFLFHKANLMKNNKRKFGKYYGKQI
ncbi:hypothetical protein EPJ90_08155 [Erysipelothrix sp. strain 2 (EsS2-7-Brazil)]|nr:hypothetical protein [Erysipelothrix sp. strain 2 (EsS2-7-Brazil)]